MKRQKLQATIKIIDEIQGILWILNDIFLHLFRTTEYYQSSAIFSDQNAFLHSEDRTSCTLYKDKKPNDGCKAIEPLHSCFSVTTLKFKMHLRFTVPCQMLVRTGGPDMMACWHIFNPTIDVKLLKIQYASHDIIIGNFKIQQHLVPSRTMERHKGH
jgi:hypothetical protein